MDFARLLFERGRAARVGMFAPAALGGFGYTGLGEGDSVEPAISLDDGGYESRDILHQPQRQEQAAALNRNQQQTGADFWGSWFGKVIRGAAEGAFAPPGGGTAPPTRATPPEPDVGQIVLWSAAGLGAVGLLYLAFRKK